MTKKVGLFLLATVLVALAMATTAPAPLEAKCLRPACFASPGCCFAYECASWCASTGGGTPGCSGGGQGGCCFCSPPES